MNAKITSLAKYAGWRALLAIPLLTGLLIVSFGLIGCPVGAPSGYGQVSSSEIHDFIDSVLP